MAVSEVVQVVGEEVGNYAKVAHPGDVLRDADLAVLDAESVVHLGHNAEGVFVGC